MKELTRDLWIKILDDLKVPFNEGESSIANLGSRNRIVFWDYVWEDISASNKSYSTLVTYQVSFFSSNPPRENSELLNLRKQLARFSIRPIIQHEYVSKDKMFHSFFSIELLENLEDCEDVKNGL